MIITVPVLIGFAFIVWLAIRFGARHNREALLVDRINQKARALHGHLYPKEPGIFNQVAVFNLRTQLEDLMYLAEDRNFYRAKNIAADLLVTHEERCQKILSSYIGATR